LKDEQRKSLINKHLANFSKTEVLDSNEPLKEENRGGLFPASVRVYERCIIATPFGNNTGLEAALSR
jgi:hypothetical protein